MSSTLVYATSGFGEMSGALYSYMLMSDDTIVPTNRLCRNGLPTAGAVGVPAGTMPMWVAMHPSRKYLYVVDMGSPSKVWAYNVRGYEGQARIINSVQSLGAGPCHLTVRTRVSTYPPSH